MQRYILTLLFFAFVASLPAAAQYEQLSALKHHSVQVYYSKGHQQRAASITQRVDKAMAWYGQLLEFTPAVTLLVLAEADWSRYTSFPVYGMPHYKDDKVLVVAAEDNAFWKSFLPQPDQLPPALQQQIKTAYSRPDGNPSMEAFFDLLALHELGHAFHLQAGINMQRKWMGELLPNILLHTYVAENEPASLPALTVFPQMVVAGGTKEFTYTSLKDLEQRYEEIGQQHAKNYGWYQSRWHVAAANIYNAGGGQIGRQLWNALKSQSEVLTDEQLAGFLAAKAGTTVADVMVHWDRDTVK